MKVVVKLVTQPLVLIVWDQLILFPLSGILLTLRRSIRSDNHSFTLEMNCVMPVLTFFSGLANTPGGKPFSSLFAVFLSQSLIITQILQFRAANAFFCQNKNHNKRKKSARITEPSKQKDNRKSQEKNYEKKQKKKTTCKPLPNPFDFIIKFNCFFCKSFLTTY